MKIEMTASSRSHSAILILNVDLQVNNIVTDLLKAFLGSGSVNTFQRETMETVSQGTNVIACSELLGF
jgi:hypothetical protein